MVAAGTLTQRSASLTTEASIRFASEILRRLGEELNPSPDQSILELVKNAYDADARHCRVELIGTDRPGGTVRITDDGDGMPLDAILDGWLVVGRSSKSARKPSRLRRVPGGDKGLGRLAALRLGSMARMVTRPRKEHDIEHHVKIDWKAFDDAEVVGDVVLPIETRPRNEQGQGTRIELTNLRLHLGRMDVKRLARAMILLADPFGDDPVGFEPILAAPEFKDLEELVRNRYFEDAEYHLSAGMDASGIAQASIRDWRGQELFRAEHADLAKNREGQPYACPPVNFDLWVFLLDSQSFANRTSTLAEVKAWLSNFGGVHLYYNRLRVAPYGNEGNDWLDMNLRRVRNPEERPGTHSSIGRVSIFDDRGKLIQKTDRSGFIEDEKFHELKAFAQDAMEWMARERLRVAELRRAVERKKAPNRSDRSRKRVEKAIEQAPLPESNRQELREKLEIYERAREREVENLRKEIQLYRTLSTAGITAATFAHESSGNPIKTLTLSISAIERRAKRELGEVNYMALIKKPVDSIHKAIDALAVLGSVTLRLIENRKRRIGRVDLHKVIVGVLDTYRPFLKGRGVAMEDHMCSGSPYLRGSEAAIESIATNLLSNSLAAFEVSSPPNRRIRLTTSIEEGVWTLSVQDNGPGIEGISIKDIWLPGQTTRVNGTGLGLTIVRDAVHDLGGRVDALAHGELGGAELLIRLPILGR